jgi:Response regulators consisting of a CheY-like receiver domain and a winged-helix DNA-binding domain
MKTKILIVDDDRDMLKIITIRLEKHGYTVITASDGDKCIEKALDESPSVILLDVILPGKSGYEICRRLKTDDKTKDIPVILITALIGESPQKHGLESGAEYVLSKPFDPKDLLWEIENVLKKRAK